MFSSVLNYDETKPEAYFAGARVDWIDQLPAGKGLHILEIGCGHGASAKYAFDQGICATYTGVEIAEDAAQIAKRALTKVVVGDVEKIELPFELETFDVLLMSEVLEHLIDPWGTLKRLLGYMKPGAKVFASSPNVAHKDFVRRLIKGRWDLTQYGPMDRTHLRWFTPETFAEMFEDAGVEIDHTEPLVANRTMKERVFSTLTNGRYDHLFWYQINLMGRKK